MADIYMGIATIASLAILFFCAGLLASRTSRSRGHCNLLAILIIVGILMYVRYLWYDVRIAELLPYSNVIVIGNWLPLGAALLAGLAWHAVPGNLLRRSLPVLSLAAAGSYAILAPVLGSPPRCSDEWNTFGFCVQTTKHTCSAACAASLLRMHGIAASEQEMADLCLTRRGTSWMGLYRGLKQKTLGTDWDVEVVKCNANELACLKLAPMILTVGLDKKSDADPSYRDEQGWIPGVDHSVILLKQPATRTYVVADPAPGIGHEYWTSDELNSLWRGYGMRLVKRLAADSRRSSK